MELKVVRLLLPGKLSLQDLCSLVLDSSGSVIITKPKATWTATLGLVVHAAADGIALGAASATSRFNIELIVFMAIMLHKVKILSNLISPRYGFHIGSSSVWSRVLFNLWWYWSKTYSTSSINLFSGCTIDGNLYFRSIEKCTFVPTNLRSMILFLVGYSWKLFSRFHWSSDAVQCGNISLRCDCTCSSRSAISEWWSTISFARTFNLNYRLLFSNCSFHGS